MSPKVDTPWKKKSPKDVFLEMLKNATVVIFDIWWSKGVAAKKLAEHLKSEEKRNLCKYFFQVYNRRAGRRGERAKALKNEISVLSQVPPHRRIVKLHEIYQDTSEVVLVLEL